VWLAVAVAIAGRATSRKETKGVLLDHLEFGRRLLQGEDVYGPWKSDPDAPIRPLHAPYPPSFGLLTAPFALVDEVAGLRAARVSWALLQLGSLVVIAVALRRLMVPRAPPDSASLRPARLGTHAWHLLWLGTFVLTSRFVLRDTHGGGGNLINVALVLLALHDSEHGRERRAGAWLAISLVTKPTMVWLVPVFALFGRWRTLASAAVAGTVAVALTMALQRFELAPWARWLHGSWALATQADPWAVPADEFPPFEWMNQALRFGVARWCGDVPEPYAARVAWGVSPGLGLPVDTVAWIVRAASGALLASVLAIAWRSRRAAGARLWTVAAALPLTLLLSPLSWKGHHVALVPLVLLLLHRAAAARSRAAMIVLGAWFVGCALPGGDLVGDDADEWLNSVYVVTFGDVALLAAALVFARSAAQEHDDAAVGRDVAH